MGVIKNTVQYLTAADDPNAPIPDFLPPIPSEGTIFCEGYLEKRSRHSYFALQCHPRKRGHVNAKAKILYADVFNSRPKKVFSLTESTTAHISSEYSQEGHSQVLKISHLDCDQEEHEAIKEISLYSTSIDELQKWKETIQLAVDRINDCEKSKIPKSKGRFFEGLVYKLTRATPHRWVERHFELKDSVLSYKHSPEEEVRWELDLKGAKIEPGRCTKESHPTAYTIRIRKGEVILDLCFCNDTSYLTWMKAICQNLELIL